MKQYSTVIVGGGIVGLTLAALLAKNNFSVAIVESKSFQAEDTHLTARVSAIHTTAIKLFHYLDCWKLRDKKACTPLQEMRIWDYTRNAELHFDSRDTDKSNMGFIIENRAIIAMLLAFLKMQDNVDFYLPHSPKTLHRADKKIQLTLDNHTLLETDLLIGADGAHSWVRNQMSVHMQTRSYHHKSIIAVIESQLPHDYCAYQKFLTTGPAALLPLSNTHHTALVWSADNTMSDALMQKSEAEFSHALTEALDFKLGKLSLKSERAQFSLTMRHADNYAENNIALVGDAAHTIHPLAGLGVNLGLMDAACLTQVLIDANNNADLRALRRYTRWRKAENTPIIAAMRGLKECFEINTPAFTLLRSAGINAIDRCALIKNALMEVAMGDSKELPAFLQKK